jgi:ribosomal-protein-alanine N-acetyltransferase
MIKEVNASKEELSVNPYLKYLKYQDKGFLKYSVIYDKIEIDHIEVKKEYRNQGIGTKLLEYLVKIAKKQNLINITLEVKETNLQAIHLYKKLNFKEVAKREKYYNGTDGILMILEMK